MSNMKEEIVTAITGILEQMLDDWGVELDEPIGADTKLVADLNFSSIDIIHLAMALEQHFKRPKLGFNELLMEDGQYVDDLTVAQITHFLETKLAS